MDMNNLKENFAKFKETQDTLKLIVDSLTVEERPSENREGYKWVKQYNHESHSIVWVEVVDESKAESPLPFTDASEIETTPETEV